MSIHVLEDSSIQASAAALVHHIHRPEWGTGMFVGEHARRRRYQFEDGKLRAFKEGFYHLLQPAETEASDAAGLLTTLTKKHDDALVRRQIEHRRRRGDLSAIRLVDQIRVFSDLYPGGFEDPLLIERSRTPEEGKRACKRHLDTALEHARVHLDPHRLHAAIQAGTHGAVLHHFVAVAKRTDLLAVGRDIKPLLAIAPTWHRELAARLFNLVLAASRHETADSESAFETAFEAWVGTLEAALETTPSWQLATAPAAFAAPKHHVLVQPTVFRLQTRWAAPTLCWSKAPASSRYLRLRDMADTVSEQLTKEGLVPRDRFDTGRFIWETLRLAGRKRLKELVSRG